MEGESDGPLMDGDFQGDLHQTAGIQLLLYQLLDDAGHAQADLGKFNQQVHGGYLQDLFWLYLIFFQVFVYMVAGHIALVKEHDIAAGKQICIHALPQVQIIQITAGRYEGVLNVHDGHRG